MYADTRILILMDKQYALNGIFSRSPLAHTHFSKRKFSIKTHSVYYAK